ncbi:hypothetical protein [Actinotalea sp. Marseille-Q4924]|uniref:hypothetical protein n=1 Tax=Actinotalea sp. Marseille-Q4924 TaxID=2866571 RepID=UPI001CE3CF0C|nr:hypothetical protein [Actinotalea sp. Marseille-Q4924]
MYSPETLLQIHHQRHDELVAVAARHATRRGADPRAEPARVGVVGDVVREASAAVRRTLAVLAGAVAGPVGARAVGGREPACCPA